MLTIHTMHSPSAHPTVCWSGLLTANTCAAVSQMSLSAYWICCWKIQGATLRILDLTLSYGRVLLQRSGIHTPPDSLTAVTTCRAKPNDTRHAVSFLQCRQIMKCYQDRSSFTGPPTTAQAGRRANMASASC